MTAYPPFVSKVEQCDGHARHALHTLRRTLSEPQGDYAASIRSVGEHLDRQPIQGRCRVIAVASPLADDSSREAASNLAHHFALAGRNVLLIDGDVETAGLTRRLAPDRTSGLLEVLWHGRPPESAILRDRFTGLQFLPSMGPSPLEPASPELLASEHMACTMSLLRQRYDRVLISAPPLLPVIDGRILANYADQILLTTSGGRAPNQIAQSVLNGLGPSRTKVAAVFVDQSDTATATPDGHDDIEADGTATPWRRVA